MLQFRTISSLSQGWLALVITLCLLGTSNVLAATNSLPVVELTSGESAQALREFVRYQLVDSSTPVPDLLQTITPDSLRSVSEPTIEFGAPKSPILVLLRVRNISSEPGTWTFSTDRGSLRHIEIFEHAGSQTHIHLAQGDLVRQKQMLDKYHAFAVDFTLLPREERILGVVFDAESSTQLLLKIMEPAAYQSLLRTQFVIVMSATIATLTLILVNALLFTVTGKSAFFHFVVAELALVFQAVHLSGYTTIYVFYEHAELARALSGVAKIVFAMFSVRFARSFLRTRETWTSFERPAQIFDAICWVAILCFLIYPLLPFLTLRLASTISMIIIAIVLLGLPIIAAVAVRRYGRVYLPLLLGWGIWGAYLVYTILTVYTPLPEIPYQWRWMAPIGFIEALMLSIALGLDIRRVQRSEGFAQKDLSEALKNRVELLEANARANTERSVALQQLTETSRLVRSSGHDSRSFTSALKIYGRMISNSENAKETQQYGALVSKISEQLDDELNRLVQGSSETGALHAQPLRLETIDVDGLINTVRQIHSQKGLNKGLEIRCRSTIREIIGDRNLLTRALSNLVSNAVKYAEAGKILIGVRVLEGRPRLQVWDQGPGMNPEQISRLLNSIHKRERYQPNIEGTGSGLGICLELCDKMRAQLSAQSDSEGGSAFTIQLTSTKLNRPLNLNIALLDDPAHWPAEVIASAREHGGVIRFVKSLSQASARNSDILIVDPAQYPQPPDANEKQRVVICSYEPNTEKMVDWLQVCEIALTKPVTRRAFEQLLYFQQIAEPE
jgi:signal transduction histidine kinase